MTTVTIPKDLVKKGDLALISLEEYKEFYDWRQYVRQFKTFTPTTALRRVLKVSQEDYKKGRHVSLDEVISKLDSKGQR